MNTNTRHIDKSFFILLEAIMKGHVLIVNDEYYRYAHKDDVLYHEGDKDYVATKSGFFKKFKSASGDDAHDIWMLIATEVSWFESLVEDIPSEEVVVVSMWLTLDGERRSVLADRMINVLGQQVKNKDKAVSIVTSYLNHVGSEAKANSLIRNALYMELQSDRLFPMGKLDFWRYETYQLISIIQEMASVVDALEQSGLIQKEVIANEVHYLKSA